MFENCGKKIKILAQILFWVTTITCVFLAFILGWTKSYSYYGYQRTTFHAELFFPLLFGGPLFAYVSSLFLCAFGELVENSDHLKELPDLKDRIGAKTPAEAASGNSDPKIKESRLKALEQLKEKGLITLAEYASRKQEIEKE